MNIERIINILHAVENAVHSVHICNDPDFPYELLDVRKNEVTGKNEVFTADSKSVILELDDTAKNNKLINYLVCTQPRALAAVFSYIKTLETELYNLRTGAHD